MFIIDEASMIPTHAQDITENNACLGGNVMLLGEDFVPCATEAVVIDTCLKRAIIFDGNK